MTDEIAPKKPTKLKKWVMETGMKQYSLAKKWGISTNHASHIIHGKDWPDDKLLEKIVDSTDWLVSPEDLFEEYRRVQAQRMAELEAKYGRKM